jgi:hypothetical protein
VPFFESAHKWLLAALGLGQWYDEDA